MIPGIVYSWSRTIPLDELEMYQFFAILSELFSIPTISFLTKKKKRKRKWRLQLVAYQSWLSLYYSPLFSTMFLMQIKPLLKAFATR